ncbi:MAG: formate dehydrogenase subunit gamma [Gammaproteobacteria bacterium]|nr:formate dehydrogenase subunit gamma [Gammaproteobacteria bacterium]
MRKVISTTKTRRRRRVAIFTVLGSLLLVMALPLTGYVANEAGLLPTAAAQESDDEAASARADYWRAVRQGTQGYSAVPGEESGVLIQNGGENWRNIRNGPISFFGASFIIAVLIALLAKHIIKGKDKLESRTGRTVTRWSAFERIMHWYVAISFIVLAITGLSLIFGRAVLMPLMGKEGFAAWAQLAKPVHDYLSLPFAAGLTIILLMWIGKNVPKAYDFDWLKSLGGAIGDGHPPAGFFNAGEKVFYWLVFFGGIVMTVSGVFLLFPNLGTVRESMQFWHIVHASSGLFLIAVALGHIYLGSIGTEGVLEGMVSGEVDEGFAKQHHSLWYEEVKGDAAAPAQSEKAPGASSAATT